MHTTTTMERYTAPDLKNCDKEPIHIIGKIQSFGYLLVLDPIDLVIEQASENIEDLIDTPANEVIGMGIDDFFPFSFLEYFHEILGPDSREDQHSLSFELHKKLYILSVHTSEGRLVLEIEPDNEDRNRSYHHYTDLVHNLVYDIDKPGDLQTTCQFVIERMQPILTFDRMMVYRFDDDNHGEVVAELAADGQPRYMGLKFPAADIPAQARKLYLKNTVRGIWNVDDQPVSVYPEIRTSDKRPLDLSQSYLRSVSPIHVEYLKNMGLKASFSISLIVKGRLWGMILCHHSKTPVRLNIHQRRACSFIGKVLSQKITSLQEEQRLEGFRSRLGVLRKLVGSLIQSGDLHQAVATHQQPLLRAFDASGYSLYYSDYHSTGSTHPDAAWSEELMKHLRYKTEKVFHTHNIRESFPDLKQPGQHPAGLLAIKLSEALNEYLLIFRDEQHKQVDWAGKPADKGGEQRLGPRQSFEKWSEETSNQCERWQADELLFAEEMRMQIIENIISSAHRPEARANHLQMRLVERNRELEEKNQQLERELAQLRKIESRYSMNRQVTAEKNHLHPVRSVKDS